MNKTIKITSIITFAMLLFGLLFKTMHWPGANVLLTCGTVTGILLFIAVLAGILPKLSGGVEKLSIIIASLTLIVAVTAMLFKTMHWSGANTLIWVADTGLLLSTIALLIDVLLEKESRIMGFKVIAAFFALLLLLISFLMKSAT